MKNGNRRSVMRMTRGGRTRVDLGVVASTVPALAILTLVACSGQYGNLAAPGTANDNPGILPPVESVDANGPFAVAIDEATGPGGEAWVYRPADLDRLGIPHPVFVWGPGAGATPASYRDHLTRIASHGFVVYSVVSTGNGREMTEALDWLVAENARAGSPYFSKLDTTRMGLGGHSRGSLSTFGAGADPRIATTIHVAGGSFDGNGPNNLRNPAAYIAGEDDPLATANATRDFENTTVPVFYTIMDGVGHVPAAREGLGVMVAWLRWQLGGEQNRRSQFLGENCDYCAGRYATRTRNW
jgi:hypothetical protein